MNREDAQERTDALAQAAGGMSTTMEAWFRMVAAEIKLGTYKTLGMKRDEWVASIDTARVRYAISKEAEPRREAVAELTRPEETGGLGLSNRETADLLGVSEHQVRNDKAATAPVVAPDGLFDGEDAPVVAPEPTTSKPKPTITLYTHKGDPVEYPEPQGKATFNATPGEGISWAEWSWNPVTGCEHSCVYCYAREFATGPRAAATYPVGFTPLFHHERLDAPANTSIPRSTDPAKRRVFVCSMADLYGRWVPKSWIDQVHAAELENPQWTYIHLTKFPRRYLEFPLPRTGWIGASVDEQKRVRHTEEAFRQIDGVALKWLSLEPLLAPLEFTDLSMFDWIVIGAQTETRQPWGVVPAVSPPARWVARIDQQAQEAGVPVHWKPNLLGRVHPQAPGMALPNEYPSRGQIAR